MAFKKQIPNLITFSRLILALLVFLTIKEKNYALALCLFLLALITDMLDGYLARKFKVVSFVGGEILEILSDGLLIFLSILGFIIIGALPFWTIIVMILGALIFLSYTRLSKSETVKDVTIIIQFLGYSTFITSISLYLSHFFSFLVTLFVLLFLAVAVYLKRERFFFVLEHGQHLFFPKENKI